jgi:hypothetical protein
MRAGGVNTKISKDKTQLLIYVHNRNIVSKCIQIYFDHRCKFFGNV